MTQTPHFSLHHDAASALAAVQTIYNQQIAHLREGLARFIAGEDTGRIQAFYPCVRIEPAPTAGSALASFDTQSAYGFVAGPGRYESTLTRPDLFAHYYREQFELLIRHHGVPLEVGLSQEPIPVHFAASEQGLAEADFDFARKQLMHMYFDAPDLAAVDDTVANGTRFYAPGEAMPLSLFSAQRVDLSLQRLRHYSGTSAECFQNFVLFTNYQFYVEEFVRMGLAQMQDPASPYIAFIEPGNRVTWREGYTPPAGHLYPANSRSGRHSGGATGRLPQMPAYHLVREGNQGISLINIGVGPANAKNITDHIAVLRPHAWIMVGHCAGLQNSQKLGDYVLAHGYIRDDHVLDDDLPVWVPIPALAEVQLALEQAVAEVAGVQGVALKSVMRTGSVASTDNRNWELLDHRIPLQRFRQGRAIALDMESATIATNGYRFRVPYGTLLCVSDKPLHGELKLPGMADQFYRGRVLQHLQIGIKAIEILQVQEAVRLHSRKLRSHADVAFR
ncbi:AMP nucleosidase [Corticibacter populi]|uniref:AMP nucleosidase n=1 Tax=Corticibacter populi TaxID=1550736 RepID=A0A3M6R164_9BURK|nr:AMP nucleosidase [Corticibacter populi]RMX08639.1 AMP nucleosidase [Corticibacter populi]RZS35971.1 AMP nucleosidase [Corticibacter populi]